MPADTVRNVCGTEMGHRDRAVGWMAVTQKDVRNIGSEIGVEAVISHEVDWHSSRAIRRENQVIETVVFIFSLCTVNNTA